MLAKLKLLLCKLLSSRPTFTLFIVIQTALRSVEDEEQEDRQIRDIESGQNFHGTIILQC